MVKSSINQLKKFCKSAAKKGCALIEACAFITTYTVAQLAQFVRLNSGKTRLFDASEIWPWHSTSKSVGKAESSRPADGTEGSDGSGGHREVRVHVRHHRVSLRGGNKLRPLCDGKTHLPPGRPSIRFRQNKPYLKEINYKWVAASLIWCELYGWEIIDVCSGS